MSRINPLYDSIKINVAITSDNHIDINSKTNSKRIKIIKKALKDVQNSVQPMDAYITVGDMTSRSTEENWECVKSCFKNAKPAKQILFALGNHDTWHKNGYEAAVGNYLKYTRGICSSDIQTPYFAKVINGYHFIFLGSTSEADNEDCAAFGENELVWFGNAMEKAALSGKPIFVFCHQSINNHHGLPRTWDENEKDRAPETGGIGRESDAVENIIKAFKNVFYFSGHSHMGLCGEKSFSENGYASFEKHDGINYINLPCLTRPNHHGETSETGTGCILEVYDDRVVIRPRNFRKRKMNKKIIIKDGKPYYEEKTD